MVGTGHPGKIRLARTCISLNGSIEVVSTPPRKRRSMNPHARTLQESPPEPYDPQYFADRQRELRWIGRKVEEGLSGYAITQPVVHMWGIRGVGKSWLLRHLRAQHGFAPGKGVKKEGTLSTLVDFAGSPLSLREPPTVADLLEKLVQEVEEQLGDRTEAAAGELAAFREEVVAVRAEERREASAVAERFVSFINRLSHVFVPLLLFDAAETLDPDDFFWLESRLIEPIARTDRAIFVVAGRREIPRWREFGARQRLSVWELGAFPRGGTLEQLEMRGRGYLGDVVHSLSFGHPYASQVVGQALDQIAGKRPVGEDFEEQHRAELAMVLEQVERELLREVRPESHKDILRTLSVLRKFNIESARFVLSGVLDPEYGKRSDAYYLRLYEELEDSNLVWWSTDHRGYVLDTCLRRIIDLRLQKGAPERYVQRHRRALELYEDWIGKNPLDRGSFLLEALYHLVSTLMGKPAEEVQRQVKRYLGRFLTSGNFTVDGADAFLQLLVRDLELQDHGRVMPKPVYEQVVQVVRSFRDKIAGVEPAEGDSDEH